MAKTYPAYLEAYDERPRPRWRRRLLVGALVALVVVAGLLITADRVAAGYAERAVADRIQQKVAQQDVRSSRPEVSVDGFPFLTQVFAGHYESISIRMRDVRGSVEGGSIRLPALDVRARNVQAPLDALRSGRGADVVAETVEGSGTITYGSVADLMNRPGLQLSERDGKLVMTAPLKFFGQEVTLDGTAKVSVQDNQVRLRFDELSAEGLPQLPAAQTVIEAYAKQISIDIPLPDLPFKLKVQQVRVLPEGLAVSAVAHDVPLSELT